MDCDHTGWNSSKIVSRLDSVECSLSANFDIMDLLQREHSEMFGLNRRGVSKNWLSAYKSANISETRQNENKVTIENQ